MFVKTQQKKWMAVLTLSSMISSSPGLSFADEKKTDTETPIRHVIVLIGENRSFDNTFATYLPGHGQTVSNLLTKGIITRDGAPGPHFAQSRQFQVNTPLPPKYFISANAANKTAYAPNLPTPELGGAPNVTTSLADLIAGSPTAGPPFDNTVPDALLAAAEPSLELSDLGLLRTGATGAPTRIGPDVRVTNAFTLPNGVFQLTGPTLPYDAYTGDTVHRLFHMWQQSDCNVANATVENPSGCLNDLYPFVGIARGDDSGSSSMAFHNVQHGDAPFLTSLADRFTMSDNFHQSAMGGTAANHMLLGSGDAIFWNTFRGQNAPPAAAVADPDPKSATSDAFTRDSAWTNCADLTQPGIAPIVGYLASLPYHPASNCETGHYYMINNLSPGFLPNGQIDSASITAGAKVPPSGLRTIGDALNEKNLSWAYFGGGYAAAARVANGTPRDAVDPLAALTYCDICNFVSYTSSIMGDPAQRQAHVKDVTDFFDGLDQGTLPAVSFVKPDALVDGHPASSKLDLFEAMTAKIIARLQGNEKLWKETALFVAFDEGGGYWDSGYMQPVDFFGDGPRIPFIVVSPYSTGGRIVHSYDDHASILKFIERNWRLRPLTARSRDNFPNPVATADNPYVPVNQPAIGDLFDMFNFEKGDQRDN
jgi:phospholipase C